MNDVWGKILLAVIMLNFFPCIINRREIFFCWTFFFFLKILWCLQFRNSYHILFPDFLSFIANYLYEWCHIGARWNGSHIDMNLAWPFFLNFLCVKYTNFCSNSMFMETQPRFNPYSQSWIYYILQGIKKYWHSGSFWTIYVLVVQIIVK